MSKDELREWDLMQNCARVMLVRGHRQHMNPGTETPATVDRCVKVAFDGDWAAFEEWAMDYAENAYGVTG